MYIFCFVLDGMVGRIMLVGLTLADRISVGRVVWTVSEVRSVEFENLF